MEEFKHSQTYVNSVLQNEIDILTNDNQSLKEMIEYAIVGGKRIRPTIAYEIVKSLKKNHSQFDFDFNLSKIIVFLEFLHSASLILDDLPCMDDDEYRRGIQTFHKRFGLQRAYVISNFMIGKSCSSIVKLVNNNKLYSKNLKELIITQIFDNNLLTSLGQIKDLDKCDNRQSAFIDNISRKLISNLHISKMLNESKLNLSNDKIKELIWLNMKTFPLFYLSFLLPSLLFLEIPNLHEEKYKEKFNIIQHISFCFSIMFQICDDLEDWEKDNNVDKINSHLKIIKIEKIKDLYSICKKEYLNGIKKVYEQNLKVLNYFVEILDKKIEIYDNGQNKK